MGSSLMQLHLTLVTLKGQCQGRRIMSQKLTELGPCVGYYTNRKPYMESPMHGSHTYNPYPGIALKGQDHEVI